MRTWRWLGYLSAAGFWGSSVVYALTGTGAVGPAEPEAGPDLSSYIAAYLAYRRELFVFEQVENWSLAVSLIAVAVLAELWGLTVVGLDRLVIRASSLLVMTGGLVAAVTQIAYVGALDRVLAASAVESFDPAPLGTMVDAVGRADDYVENFGFLLIAVGTLGMARLARQSSATSRGWTTLCLALALGIATVVATSFAVSAVRDVALVVVGVALAPLWAIALAHGVDRASTPAPT